MSEKLKRTFTIQGSAIGYEGGRYKHNEVYRAASKAGRQLFRVIKRGKLYRSNPTEYAKYAKYSIYAHYDLDKPIKFLLRETTLGSNKETYYYDAIMHKLDTPEVIEKNGVKIVVNDKVKIKTCNDEIGSVKF